VRRPHSLSPPRVRAVEVLREVLERGGQATGLLTARGEGLGKEDQGLLREIVLGVLRQKARLDGELAAVSRVPLERLAPDLREILEVALFQVRFLDRVPAYAAVDEAVRHARESAGEGAAKLVNAILRNLLRRPHHPAGEGRGEGGTTAATLAREFSHPPFLVERWLERFGEETTRSILTADNAPSGLDLLVNPLRTSRALLAGALAEEGISVELSPLVPLGLTVLSGNPLRSPLFREGHFSVQDIGSQALPLLLPPGDTLVDLAAAPGGKSFAALFSERVRRSVALDRSAARLRLFTENVRRLGVSRALPVAGDFLSPPFPSQRFDRVLLDAPCSGTGTLRKHPEIRYRVSPQAIERLARVQEDAVLAAAGLLAPGGLLLYSTCSLEEEENERVVERALRRDAGLEPAPIEAFESLEPFVSGSRFRIFPGPVSDGFTAHLLRRGAARGARIQSSANDRGETGPDPGPDSLR
jgi:16S rRNA (cytosine967-C5)-methyltransferase